MKKIKYIIMFVISIFIMNSLVVPIYSMSNKEATAIMKIEFIRLSKLLARKRSSLTKKECRVAEDIMAISSKLVSEHQYKKADALLDDLKDMLNGKRSFFIKKNHKKSEKKRVIPKIVKEDKNVEEDLSNMTFTLQDAFKSPEEKRKEIAQKIEKEQSEEKEPPKVIPFNLKNLSKKDQKNYKILGSILPEVEETFKLHPNPETADAMKNTRKFFYYLKKKAMGFPENPLIEEDLDRFIEDNISKN